MTEKTYQAECKCGWHGNSHELRADAEKEGREHVCKWMEDAKCPKCDKYFCEHRK